MQYTTQQLKEAVPFIAGIWVSVDERFPSPGEVIVRMENMLLPFKVVYRISRKQDFIDNKIQWLDPNHPAITALLQLLDSREEEEKSDGEAAAQYAAMIPSAITRASAFNRFLSGRQSLRPKITALENKVIEQAAEFVQVLYLLDCATDVSANGGTDNALEKVSILIEQAIARYTQSQTEVKS